MKISFISLFPDVIQNYLSSGIIGRAQQKRIIDVEIFNLRDQATGSYKSVDDTVYGGADGALIQYEPLKKTLDQIDRIGKNCVIYLSPQGRKLDNDLISQLKTYDQLILISGRYAGIDQRFITRHVDQEISIGDYVLCGGELPGLVLVEALSRQLEGVLGNQDSARNDSFQESLLEAPQFTKPNEIEGMKVPAVLLSGDHQKINQWRNDLRVLVTLKKRPDLIEKISEKNFYKIDWNQIMDFYERLSSDDKFLMQIENLTLDIESFIKKNLDKI